jgi:hypothetical protein
MAVDREKDVQLLTTKLEGIMDKGGDIIHIMEIQRKRLSQKSLTLVGEQQQEAIAALQRRVDQIAVEEIDRHHPYKRLENSIDSAKQPERDVSVAPTSALDLDISTATSSEIETRSMSPIGDVPLPRRGLERQFSTGNRAFEERALAVSASLYLSYVAHPDRHFDESAVIPRILFQM